MQDIHVLEKEIEMKRIARLTLIIPLLLVMSCSADHGDSPTGFEFSAPDSPTAFTVTPSPNELTLEWDYPGDLAEVSEFRVYYYYEMYGLEEFVGTASGTTYTDTDLIGNMIYCYKVSAVDLDGHEGLRTETICEMTQD